MAVCLVCANELGDSCIGCFACDTQYHTDCASYNRNCAVYGCGGDLGTSNTPVVYGSLMEYLSPRQERQQAHQKNMRTITKRSGVVAAVAWAVGYYAAESGTPPLPLLPIVLTAYFSSMFTLYGHMEAYPESWDRARNWIDSFRSKDKKLLPSSIQSRTPDSLERIIHN